MKRFFQGLVLIMFLVAIYFLFKEQQYQAYLDQSVTPDGQNELHEFVVEKGETLKNIAESLYQNQLIVDTDTFIRYVKEQALEKSLQAGTFYVNPSLTIGEVVDVLLGNIVPDQVRLTIPEGYTITQIGALLEERNLGTAEAFITCVEADCDYRDDYDFLPDRVNIEGYLFPDTYFMSSNSYTPERLLRKMLDNFHARVIIGLAEEINASERTLDENIIMSSIIEKESRPRDNQNIVAGILWKRLDNDVQLAADATTRYAKDDPLAELTIQDLTSTDPYNSRKVKGLPPSGISNPGLASIKATLAPEDSPYWYYLHAPDGQIYFASTENEHNRNKALYLGN